VAILVIQFVKPSVVREHSMEDTLHNGDYIFLARQAYSFGEFEHGDIVVFESFLLGENGANKNLVKRVIGLPGDTIEIHDGFVWRNGEKLIEPYTKDGRTDGELGEVTVPEHGLFVLGDNRQNSTDSRSPTIGYINEVEVLGKAIFRMYPFADMGTID
jgi:signal peptidase I